MRRREVLKLLGGAAGVWPFAASAQQERVRRIGVLMGPPEGDSEGLARVTGFRRGLEAAGWREGYNIQLEYRWGASEGTTATQQAAALVAQQPDIILVNTPAGLAALQRLSNSIPIVFVQFVSHGFVESTAKPGGNATGFTMLEDTLDEKWLELLSELSPNTRRVAFIQNPEHPSWHRYHRSIAAAAPKFGMAAIPSPVHDPSEIEHVIADLARDPGGALIVLPATFNTAHRKAIINGVARHRVPAVYPNRFYAVDGGLVSYGGDLPDLMRQAATYVDRVLRGVRPSDLPVQQTTKLELVINLKTARTLGLIVPPSLLARADEVIE
jgi:putative tryptophan/tyrosine transport system substrate-binding protein